MLTTEGSTCLAIWVNVLESSTGLGMTSGVAPGAAWLSLAAFTPELIRVPITMPIDSVNRINVNESSFCVRNLLKKLMDLLNSSVNSLTSWMQPRIQGFQFHQHNPAQDESGARGTASRQALTHDAIRRNPGENRL